MENPEYRDWLPELIKKELGHILEKRMMAESPNIEVLERLLNRQIIYFKLPNSSHKNKLVSFSKF